jgi:hypothetical protein
LVVNSRQVDFGEDGTTEKLVGVIMDMPDGVAFGNGTGVEGSVIATGAPPVFLLECDVESRRPRILGGASCAVPQRGVELGFGYNEPIRCQPPCSAGDRWSRYSSDMMESIMADFALDASEFREFGEEAVDRCAASGCLHSGDQRVGGMTRYG